MSSDPGTEKRGSGLGLAIVKSIAERHQGRCGLRPNSAKVARFTCKFRLVDQFMKLVVGIMPKLWYDAGSKI